MQGCRMCGGTVYELENKKNGGNLNLIESLGNKHDDFQEKVKNVLMTSHCDAFANITLVNVSNAANPMDVILLTDESNHDMNPQVNNFVPTSRYGVDVMRPPRDSSTPERAMLKDEQGVLKVEINHVFSKAMTYDCRTITEAAIAEAYNDMMDDGDDLETNLEETIFIDEEMDNIVKAGDLKAYNAWTSLAFRGPLWFRTYQYIGYACRTCRQFEYKLGGEENVDNLDLIDILGNKHDDFQKKVKDILLDSHCGAFANITSVKISNALISADDLHDSNLDINIKID